MPTGSIEPHRQQQLTGMPVCGGRRLLDRTKTRAGVRLLRANLLQPLRDIATLNLRFDCIEELLAKEDLAGSIGSCLSQLPQDLDRQAARALGAAAMLAVHVPQ